MTSNTIMSREHADANLQILFHTPLDKIWPKNETQLEARRQPATQEKLIEKIKKIIDETFEFARRVDSANPLYIVYRTKNKEISISKIRDLLPKLVPFYSRKGSDFSHRIGFKLGTDTIKVLKNPCKAQKDYERYVESKISELEEEGVGEHGLNCGLKLDRNTTEESEKLSHEVKKRHAKKHKETFQSSQKNQKTEDFRETSRLIYTLNDLAEGGHFEIIRYLICDLDFLPAEVFRNLTMRAAGRGYFDFIYWLISLDEKKSLSDALSEFMLPMQLWPLVSYALMYNRIDFIDKLSLEHYQIVREDLIFMAVSLGRTSFLESQLQKVLPGSLADEDFQKNVFLNAVQKERIECLKILMLYWTMGEDLSFDCATKAIKVHCSKTLSFLLEIHPNLPTQELFLYCVRQKSYHCLKFLIESRGINQKKFEQCVFIAATSIQPKILELLLNYGKVSNGFKKIMVSKMLKLISEKKKPPFKRISKELISVCKFLSINVYPSYIKNN